MAAAYSSKMLGIPATIVIPKSTPSIMISKLAEEKANVIVSSWCKYYIHHLCNVVIILLNSAVFYLLGAISGMIFFLPHNVGPEDVQEQ